MEFDSFLGSDTITCSNSRNSDNWIQRVRARSINGGFMVKRENQLYFLSANKILIIKINII